MAHPKELKGTIALLGAAAAAVVAVLLGVLYWSWSGKPAAPQAGSSAQTAQPVAPQAQSSPGQQLAAAKPPAASETPAAAQPKDAPIVPSFDVVRVEPDGESVIAGRAAPGATIELLRGDQVHARAAADASGLFAIVPPPLPPGSHQVVLQSIAPDGTRQRSAQAVTVVITDGKTRPLVTLTSPDKPTVVLSNPEPPETKVAEAPKSEAEPAAPPAPQQQAGAAPTVSPPPPAAPPAAAAAGAPSATPSPRPEIKIVTVEAEEGKLYVSGQSSPGATIRLYLNESFIAPGGAGGDGRVSFSIASGVKPGDYRIRLDDVDPVSGQVRSRAEVGFNVPAQVASAQPQAPAPGQQRTSGSPASSQPQASREVASALPQGQLADAGTIVIPNINTAIVSRGDNLWRISQRVYGKGLRYTVIYGANQEQIRNPDLIYPGQVFVLPGDQEPRSN
ncbi:LysM peptidoglycan-binding domain-containing protein [Microvirga splendida]|uniref:LysM peptidoglycan-binding domain-containing protein n=1 Tax=Microvirga splendida TaxID=2795727 RepID=A0ABS0Y0P7_9HYPH|nr:LysM peptidoglycan-binding domain-containing protein [Microvirga splendida]MBJ6125851.1 LysM peptidoglycan-binding domain-containing protein [Microvirga splendida]